MANDFKMVVIDGVRYRPEDAPNKKAVAVEKTEDEKAAEKPANKSKPVANK